MSLFDFQPIPDTNLPIEIFNVRLPSDSNQDISLEPEGHHPAFFIGSDTDEIDTVTKLKVPSIQQLARADAPSLEQLRNNRGFRSSTELTRNW